jgi:hypothetical protein
MMFAKSFDEAAMKKRDENFLEMILKRDESFLEYPTLLCLNSGGTLRRYWGNRGCVGNITLLCQWCENSKVPAPESGHFEISQIGVRRSEYPSRRVVFSIHSLTCSSHPFLPATQNISSLFPQKAFNLKLSKEPTPVSPNNESICDRVEPHKVDHY